ncbi:hypothetical protein B0T11DRAFT_343679 [Plectosphaerella cucumerina]|uniref:Uncharacterized protein n=1 Tax=Plectosphaerella cucumerina TaxID=40658 RepID=A0A8K0T1W1_9PEZI|nr:hypothetical protein B0T11DRAFT_343679 [Plectosphaerella cucumerina]
MATTETLSQPHDRVDRPGRRRPFSTWVKKLTNFNKGSSSTDTRLAADPKRAHKKRGSKKNNPYPQSATINYLNGRSAEHQSAQSFVSERSGSATSLDRRRHSDDGQPPHTAGGARSLAPTVATERHSIMAPSSVAGTSRTVGGMDSRRGGDSTFSSPAPSVRSLTTTLTTIQSVAPNLQGAAAAAHPNPGHTSNQSQSIQFHQPFPTTSPPSAIPSHLAPSSTGPGHPTTYSSATANNLLTDNASILTLASSSKRRRRRSFDTDASVRALAPSSLWGGSRESLPLSVLSSNVDQAAGSSGAARANAERTSIYSATGVVPALPSERNSFYYARQRDPGGDGASTRSGILGHGRAESISGSIIGVTSPLSSPRDGARGERSGVEEKDENEAAATAEADKTGESER